MVSFKNIILFAGLFVYVVNAEIKKRFVNEIDIPTLVQRLDDLTERVAENERKLRYHPVAFKAHLSQKMVSPAPNQRIIFDDVQLNIGNAYHGNLGGFIAPVNGTYLFSVSICSDGNHFIVLDLMRNSNMIGRVLAGDTVYNDCSSETTIAELKSGDEIYVQHHLNVGDLLQVQQHTLDSFTGALLAVI
ncbi:HIP-like protein [Mya arenaria]|uniref:HIP-like protein n=1 Tax=Mya arenaria TaxID=6604 RepID=A0ABY7EPU6_MYAAR|nr:heavy metal-binding protein HIP-like [Mya arenaria]WAR12003.1 HIP-like protein [Mya arenaria]